MNNVINKYGNSDTRPPLDMGDLGTAHGYHGPETTVHSVRTFMSDGVDNRPASTQALDTAAKNTAPQGADNGSGLTGMLGQIMDVIKSAISAATPLIGMFGSMFGGLLGGGGGGGGGGGAGGTGAA